MRLALLALLTVLGCAHSPAPAPGLRPLGKDFNLVRGEATLAVRLRYQVTAPRSVTLQVDLVAGGTGSVGPVEVKVAPEGLTLEGPDTWTGEAAAGTTTAARFALSAATDRAGRVTVSHTIAGAPASDPVVVRFLFSDDETRACQASEEACRMPGDPPLAPSE